MLVVRLDNVLEDIIRYESETSGVDIAAPVLKKLDYLERRVSTELYKIPEEDEDYGGIKGEKRRKISALLKNFCIEALIPSPRQSDIIKMYKINAILHMSLNDPFESFIKKAVEHTMMERTQPIMEILELLEEKVEEYGQQAIMSCDMDTLNEGLKKKEKTLPWHNEKDKYDDVFEEEKESKKHIKLLEECTNISEEREKEKTDLIERALVVAEESRALCQKEKCIIRITTWRYDTTQHPSEPSKIYLDLTKKKIELLVEIDQDQEISGILSDIPNRMQRIG